MADRDSQHVVSKMISRVNFASFSEVQRQIRGVNKLQGDRMVESGGGVAS